MKSNKYDKDFYVNREVETSASAEAILDEVFDMCRPDSVVDFGCGVGTWLKVCNKKGAKKLLGFEGQWIEDLPKGIVSRCVAVKDLSKKIVLDHEFDLAITLEVAEHIKELDAEIFVDNLANASNIVLFSAAIPGQGGVGHLNEQWPRYWVEKFEQRGFRLFDVLRPSLWENQMVKVWYKQNTLLFVRGAPSLVEMELLESKESFAGRSLVHPDLLKVRISQLKSEITVGAFIKSIKRGVQRFIKIRS